MLGQSHVLQSDSLVKLAAENVSKNEKNMTAQLGSLHDRCIRYLSSSKAQTLSVLMDEAACQPRQDNKFLPGEVAWVGLLDSASPGIDY